MQYGQFCPIAKATEIIGEKWTILIIRELLMGGTRFNELQRGLSLISPTLLSKRLESLANHGLVQKKKIKGQRGFEYFPTTSCKELMPIILNIGEWGMAWAKSNLTEKDYDVELLMLYLKRSIVKDNIPGNHTVIKFNFTDVDVYPEWWIVVSENEIDLCVNDPGHEVDIYFTTKVKTMADVWTGQQSYKQSIRNKEMTIIGDSYLSGSVTRWLSNAIFSDIPSATEI